MTEQTQTILAAIPTDVSGKWMAVGDVEKLTKLVAEECMNIIAQNRKYASEHKWPASELANVCLYEINETFGVQEDGKETVSG
jgi:hypothetical protein